MHPSTLLALLPLLSLSLASSLRSPLVQRDSCLITEQECGTGCIPSSYSCCGDGNVGGCPETSTCTTKPNGKTGCCVDTTTCKDDFDFTNTLYMHKTGHVGDDGGDDLTAAASSSAAAALSSASAAASSGAAASSTGGVAAGSTTSSGSAAAVTEMAGVVVAIGAGVAMFL